MAAPAGFKVWFGLIAPVTLPVPRPRKVSVSFVILTNPVSDAIVKLLLLTMLLPSAKVVAPSEKLLPTVPLMMRF